MHLFRLFPLLFLLALSLVTNTHAQLRWPHAVLNFTGVVDQVFGEPFPGLQAGHTFTGRLEVSLGSLPPDTNSDLEEADYIYTNYPPLGFFQLGIDFQTEGPIVHTRSFQPVPNVPFDYPPSGIFLANHPLAAHGVTFRLQYTLRPYGLLLQFRDTNDFPTLLRGDRFPEHVNPAFPFQLSELSTYEYYGTNALHASITGASFTIIPGDTPGLYLTERVTGAPMPERLKKRLLKKSRSITAALERHQCRAARVRTKSFQNIVRRQLQPTDAPLAAILMGRAQSTIDEHCPPRSTVR